MSQVIGPSGPRVDYLSMDDDRAHKMRGGALRTEASCVVGQ